MTVINVTAGAKEYVGGTITETTGKDISADLFEVALSSTRDAPVTGWGAPNVDVQGDTTATRVLKLLIDNTTTLGRYWMWVRVTDNPEVVPRILQTPIDVQ